MNEQENHQPMRVMQDVEAKTIAGFMKTVFPHTPYIVILSELIEINETDNTKTYQSKLFTNLNPIDAVDIGGGAIDELKAQIDPPKIVIASPSSKARMDG